jgi:Domain of unknown function (DUF6048)
MRRICVYFINILVIIFSNFSQVKSQDTILIPLKINAGLEAVGPVTYFIDKNTLSAEGYVSMDLNEKWAVALNAGYLDYDFSQYNYTYLNKGFFIRAGADFNILKPKKSLGKYWGGIGLRYGLSHFKWAVPEFSQSNYWGKSISSIPVNKDWGHFIEASPGMRAEIFRNFSLGWSINVRMLLYTGAGKDLKPIYFPGFGNGVKRFSTGFSYFIVWHIPYKKITVITKKEEPEETDDTEEPNSSGGTGAPGSRQQQPGNITR